MEVFYNGLLIRHPESGSRMFQSGVTRVHWHHSWLFELTHGHSWCQWALVTPDWMILAPSGRQICLIVIGKIDIDIEIVMDIPKKLTLKLPLISRSEIIGIDIAIENEVGKNWHWYCHWHYGLKIIDIDIAIDIKVWKKNWHWNCHWKDSWVNLIDQKCQLNWQKIN